MLFAKIPPGWRIYMATVTNSTQGRRGLGCLDYSYIQFLGSGLDAGLFSMGGTPPPPGVVPPPMAAIRGGGIKTHQKLEFYWDVGVFPFSYA